MTRHQSDTSPPGAVAGPFGMGEHKCVVGYCCCGCSLRTGSLAIGVVVLVLSLLSAIYNIFGAIKYGGVNGYIGFVVNLIVVIVSCFLIQGIRQERRGYVMAWVGTMAVIIIINIVMSIIVLITTFNLVFGIITLLVMALFIYLVVVVRSYGLTLGSSPGVA